MSPFPSCLNPMDIRRQPALAILLMTGLLTLVPAPATAFFDGPDVGYAGAPGRPDRGRACTECHNSFALNSGPGSVRILGAPARYVPGQTYDLMVQVAQKG